MRTLLFGIAIVLSANAYAEPDSCRTKFAECVGETGFPPACQTAYQSCLASTAEENPSLGDGWMTYRVSHDGINGVRVHVDNVSPRIATGRAVEVTVECKNGQRSTKTFELTDRVASGETSRLAGLKPFCEESKGLKSIVSAGFLQSKATQDEILISANSELDVAAMPNLIKIELVATIRDKPGALFPGEKIRHTVLFEPESEFIQGSVKANPTELNFDIYEVFSFDAQVNLAEQAVQPGAFGSEKQVRLQAEAATGVSDILPFPAVNYDIRLHFRGSTLAGISGCHDGYPSYEVFVGGEKYYDHEQGYLAELVGSCDTIVSVNLRAP